MIIPKTFKLGGLPFTVRIVDHIDNAETHGLLEFDEGSVRILKNDRREAMEQAYCHELIHALFSASGRDDLGANEGLVDTMAIFLHQHNVSQKGSL